MYLKICHHPNCAEIPKVPQEFQPSQHRLKTKSNEMQNLLPVKVGENKTNSPTVKL